MYIRFFLISAFYLLLQLNAIAGTDTTQVFTGTIARHTLFTNSGLSQWFMQGYNNYSPEKKALEQVRTAVADLSGLTIKVVFGTWCPDSHMEVPRLVKVLDMAAVDTAAVNYIAVNRQKKGDDKSFDKLKVTRVPTVIIYKQTAKGLKEVGRIKEHPDKSYEAHLAKILNRLKP